MTTITLASYAKCILVTHNTVVGRSWTFHIYVQDGPLREMARKGLSSSCFQVVKTAIHGNPSEHSDCHYSFRTNCMTRVDHYLLFVYKTKVTSVTVDENVYVDTMPSISSPVTLLNTIWNDFTSTRLQNVPPERSNTLPAPRTIHTIVQQR